MKIIDLEIPYNEAFETEADQYLNKIFNKRKVYRIVKPKKINLKLKKFFLMDRN
jgi:hypothetical protein